LWPCRLDRWVAAAVTRREPTWMVASSAVRCSPPPAGGNRRCSSRSRATGRSAGCRRPGRPGRGRTAAGSRPRPGPAHRTRTSRCPAPGRSRLAGWRGRCGPAAGRPPARPTSRPPGPDPGHDGVQVHLVGLFPAGAGDVPGPNPQARHRHSIAERLPPGEREGGPLVRAEDRCVPTRQGPSG
jgi:hypothetical protein